jgi:hypothetical protein
MLYFCILSHIIWFILSFPSSCGTLFVYLIYFKALKHLTFVTTCFGLYDHHHVLRLQFEEVAVFPFS